MLISLARVAFYLLVKTEEVELLACEIVSINVHASSRTKAHGIWVQYLCWPKIMFSLQQKENALVNVQAQFPCFPVPEKERQSQLGYWILCYSSCLLG